MKKLMLALICLVSLAFVTQNVEGLPQYKITDPYSSPSGFNGGPFYVDPLPLGGTDGFVTFCLEMNENFTSGNVYYGSIEDGAIFGGVGGQTTTGYDPLDNKTKYLYSYFLDNQSDILGNIYKYTGMQLAIWYLENEISNFTGYDESSIYWAQEYLKLDGSPKYNIMVLNLWTYNYQPGQSYQQIHKAQSQLIMVPEPGVLILLGIGLTALALVARRYRKV